MIEALKKGPPDAGPIASAAVLVLDAYVSMIENTPKPKAERKAPQQPALRALLPKADGAYVESDLNKIFFLAILRYSQLLGKPTITEEQIRNLPDHDGLDPKITAKTPDNSTPDLANTDEHVLYVDTNGITLDDNPIKIEQLAQKLREIQDAENRLKRKLQLTLQAEEQSTYKTVRQVLDEIDKAKIKNVTFRAPLDRQYFLK